jgi:hypothetical protein
MVYTRKQDMDWYQKGNGKLVRSIVASSVVAETVGKGSGIEILWHVKVSEVYELWNYLLTDPCMMHQSYQYMSYWPLFKQYKSAN